MASTMLFLGMEGKTSIMLRKLCREFSDYSGLRELRYFSTVSLKYCGARGFFLLPRNVSKAKTKLVWMRMSDILDRLSWPRFYRTLESSYLLSASSAQLRCSSLSSRCPQLANSSDDLKLSTTFLRNSSKLNMAVTSFSCLDCSASASNSITTSAVSLREALASTRSSIFLL